MAQQAASYLEARIGSARAGGRIKMTGLWCWETQGLSSKCPTNNSRERELSHVTVAQQRLDLGKPVQKRIGPRAVGRGFDWAEVHGRHLLASWSACAFGFFQRDWQIAGILRCEIKLVFFCSQLRLMTAFVPLASCRVAHCASVRNSARPFMGAISKIPRFVAFSMSPKLGFSAFTTTFWTFRLSFAKYRLCLQVQSTSTSPFQKPRRPGAAAPPGSEQRPPAPRRPHRGRRRWPRRWRPPGGGLHGAGSAPAELHQVRRRRSVHGRGEEGERGRGGVGVFVCFVGDRDFWGQSPHTLTMGRGRKFVHSPTLKPRIWAGRHVLAHSLRSWTCFVFPTKKLDLFGFWPIHSLGSESLRRSAAASRSSLRAMSCGSRRSWRPQQLGTAPSQPGAQRKPQPDGSEPLRNSCFVLGCVKRSPLDVGSIAETFERQSGMCCFLGML